MSDHVVPLLELLDRYAHGAEALRKAIVGLSAEELRARPIPGKMSTLEVVAHIADSDQMMCYRLKRTIGAEKPLLMGVETADYPGPLHYHGRDPELDLRLLEVQREQMLADLRRLPADAWSHTAVHSELGLVTLADLFEHAVDHLESHMTAIAQKREVLGK